MLGTIAVLDLEIRCIVGVLPHEREIEQSVFLDIEFDHDFADAARTDQLQYTFDYAEISQVITAFVREQKFYLIETMAERCCAMLFERFPEMQRIKATIRKPAAIPTARCAAVSIERRRAQS
jgi:7,8-dihydroneopterin aldolase/epimerase/oxygenase